MAHLRGHSFRDIGDSLNISHMNVYRRVLRQLRRIPNSNHVTETVVRSFEGYLMVDAKYVSVKGHTNKMAFIWAIDYYTHDILWFELVSGETYAAYLHIFSKLRSSGYRPKVVICDELPQIWKSAREIFPEVKIQLCTVHLKRNIKKVLSMKDDEDREFFSGVVRMFAARKLKHFAARGRNLLQDYAHRKKYVTILRDLMFKGSLVTTYLENERCPNSTNLIECYNKHLNKRLRKFDGFKTYQNALLWLNGYVMLKRTSKLKNCKGKFKHLNGQVPLALNVEWNAPGIYFFNN